MYYLQIRRDILSGYTFCEDEMAMFFASLALQAEYGDYSEKHYGKSYFTLEYYVPGRVSFEMHLFAC